MGYLLYLIARLGLFILRPIFILWAIFRLLLFNKNSFKDRLRNSSDYFGNVAFSIDQTGNAMGSVIMNDLLTTKDSKKLYGNVDETISHVTGVNHQDKTLTLFGIGVARMLNNVDTNHVQKASITEQDNTEQKEK